MILYSFVGITTTRPSSNISQVARLPTSKCLSTAFPQKSSTVGGLSTIFQMHFYHDCAQDFENFLPPDVANYDVSAQVLFWPAVTNDKPVTPHVLV